MAEIVNLRRVRKRLAREKDAQQAEENRVLHGRTRAERELRTLTEQKERRFLDGRRLDDLMKKSPDDEPSS